MKKIIGSMTFLIAITLACYVHAGFFDRYLELVDVLYAVLKTIFVSQVIVFLLIKFCRFKIAKRIRMRLHFCKWDVVLVSLTCNTLFVVSNI